MTHKLTKQEFVEMMMKSQQKRRKKEFGMKDYYMVRNNERSCRYKRYNNAYSRYGAC